MIKIKSENGEGYFTITGSYCAVSFVITRYMIENCNSSIFSHILEKNKLFLKELSPEKNYLGYEFEKIEYGNEKYTLYSAQKGDFTYTEKSREEQ